MRQEFGRSSIKFHEPQCERKRVAEDLRREKERREEGEENKVSYIDHIGEDIERLEAKGNKIANIFFVLIIFQETFIVFLAPLRSPRSHNVCLSLRR